MGAYLDKPITEKESQDGDTGGSYAFGSSGMQGWRTNMEDTHVNELSFDGDAGAGLFAVFDGHGGSEVAKFCRDNLSKILLDTAEYKDGLYAEGLGRAFLALDENILAGWPNSVSQYSSPHAYGRGDNPYDEGGAGCTAVSCLIKGSKLYIANAGDSRIVLCRSGKAIELSTDHKPELHSEAERIRAARGYITDGRVNGNLNLTRAIGDFAYKKNSSITPDKQIITANPDISAQDLVAEDEFLILGCDGVWDRKTSQEVVDFVKPRIDRREEGERLSLVVEALLDTLVSPNVSQTDGLGCDNMTCVIVDLMAAKRRAGSTPPEATATPESPTAGTANAKLASGMRRLTVNYETPTSPADSTAPSTAGPTYAKVIHD